MSEHRITLTDERGKHSFPEPTIRTSATAKEINRLIKRYASIVDDFETHLAGDAWHRLVRAEFDGNEMFLTLTAYGKRMLIAALVIDELSASGIDADAEQGDGR